MSASPKATDLELVKACAEAMELDHVASEKHVRTRIKGSMLPFDAYYDPLHDDAQCFALVKRFRLDIVSSFNNDKAAWVVSAWNGSRKHKESFVGDPNLNRAIVECVAQLRSRRA